MKIGCCSNKIGKAVSGEKNGTYSELTKLLKSNKAQCTTEDVIETLNALEAASSVADLPASYRFHALSGKYNGKYAVNIDSKHRIIFSVNGTIENGNKNQMRDITIEEIGTNYH